MSVAVSGIAVCGDGSAVVDRLDGGFVTPLAGTIVGIACAGVATARNSRAKHAPRRAIAAAELMREQRRYPASHPKTEPSIRHLLSRFLESTAKVGAAPAPATTIAPRPSRVAFGRTARTLCEVYGVCNRGVRHVIGHPAYQAPPGSGVEGLGEVSDAVVEGRTLTVR